MIGSLIVIIVPLIVKGPEPKLDLTYQPCAEMYQEALKTGRQSDMRRVQNLCGIRTESKESEQ